MVANLHMGRKGEVDKGPMFSIPPRPVLSQSTTAVSLLFSEGDPSHQTQQVLTIWVQETERATGIFPRDPSHTYSPRGGCMLVSLSGWAVDRGLLGWPHQTPS